MVLARKYHCYKTQMRPYVYKSILKNQSLILSNIVFHYYLYTSYFKRRKIALKTKLKQEEKKSSN